MKVILFQDIIRSTRTSDDIIKIIRETGAEMLLRSASRVGKTSLHGTNYTRLSNIISQIKASFPNVKIIGNIYFQLMDKAEMDDITLQSWTEQETYDQLCFDPANFGVTSITKCEYQCYNPTGTCTCLGPGEAQSGRRIPDITIPLVQTFFIHQVQRLLDAGCDGVWIDGPFFNAQEVIKHGSASNIQRCIDASLYVFEQMRTLKTLNNQTPQISTWYSDSNRIPYLQNSPYWHDNFFDFVTITLGSSEIYGLTPKQDYDKIIDNVKTYQSNVPIILYIDWSFGKHPLWYFSQWYPDYTTCCEATDYQKRHDFQISVLKTFTTFINSKGISWAYPIYGGGMCGLVTCDQETRGPCCVTASLDPAWPGFYDAQAPEFQTYDTIKELMNPTTSQSSIGPIIIAGLLLGGLYLYFKNKKK